MDQVVKQAVAVFEAYLVAHGHKSQINTLKSLAAHVTVGPGEPGTLATRLIEAAIGRVEETGPVIDRQPALEKGLSELKRWDEQLTQDHGRAMVDLIVWVALWDTLIKDQVAHVAAPYQGKGFNSEEALSLFRFLVKLSGSRDLAGQDSLLDRLCLLLLDFVNVPALERSGALSPADKTLIEAFLAKNQLCATGGSA